MLLDEIRCCKIIIRRRRRRIKFIIRTVSVRRSRKSISIFFLNAYLFTSPEVKPPVLGISPQAEFRISASHATINFYRANCLYKLRWDSSTALERLLSAVSSNHGLFTLQSQRSGFSSRGGGGCVCVSKLGRSGAHSLAKISNLSLPKWL